MYLIYFTHKITLNKIFIFKLSMIIFKYGNKIIMITYKQVTYLSALSCTIFFKKKLL